MILMGLMVGGLAFLLFPFQFAAGVVVGMMLANWHRSGNPFGY